MKREQNKNSNRLGEKSHSALRGPSYARNGRETFSSGAWRESYQSPHSGNNSVSSNNNIEGKTSPNSINNKFFISKPIMWVAFALLIDIGVV